METVLTWSTFTLQNAKEDQSVPEFSTREADAFSLAAAVAPTTTSEAVRRGSMLSATSSVSSPDGTRTRVAAAVDNLAYVAEESVEQRL